MVTPEQVRQADQERYKKELADLAWLRDPIEKHLDEALLSGDYRFEVELLFKPHKAVDQDTRSIVLEQIKDRYSAAGWLVGHTYPKPMIIFEMRDVEDEDAQPFTWRCHGCGVQISVDVYTSARKFLCDECNSTVSTVLHAGGSPPTERP